MLQRIPRAPSTVPHARRGHAGLGAGRWVETIRVGRMPRTDSFRIGVEVLPRQLDDGPEAIGWDPRPAA